MIINYKILNKLMYLYKTQNSDINHEYFVYYVKHNYNINMVIYNIFRSFIKRDKLNLNILI